MPHDPDRHSTRRTYLARTGALLGTTGLGMSAVGSAGAHDSTEKDHDMKEKEENKDGDYNEDGKKEKDGKDHLFLTHFAHLDGKNEVPSVKTDAKGAVGFVVDKCDEKVRFIIHVKDLCNITAAHIHLGKKGENGPIVVGHDLEEEKTKNGRFDGVLAQGVVKKEDFAEDFKEKDFKKFLKKMDNKELYVNVHTKKNPDGEIRGQIKRAKKEDMKKDGEGGFGGPRI
ncbi:CHRD domain-containing protein [Halalkalicoccus sp. NIPERK01]|uniref:CHRD domain-containing protein n=1 Tax=Halalkalicoccus sp. NIPERK01 TaxID=3053469 RepID=UPI00256EBD94|nr:CHRD domain-containing protein [Halalkalicoccus sp. NIPERK01]MDL5360659.1 CHRD domain-containing protein [Halalkalicoccus sp. NIPERK01]